MNKAKRSIVAGATIVSLLTGYGSALSAQNKTFVSNSIESGVEGAELINDIETWGDKAPLSFEQLNNLIEVLNKQEREMSENVYYGTFYISKSKYEEFKNKDITAQLFYKKHEEVLNLILANATNGQIKFQIRRLIVLQDDIPVANVGNSTNIGYIDAGGRNRIHDSDGIDEEGITYDLNNVPFDFVPAGVEASDKVIDGIQYKGIIGGIDYGLIHEWMHRFLHIIDTYSQDFEIYESMRNGLKSDDPEIYKLLPKELNEIPLQWLSYFSFQSTPFDLMGGGRQDAISNQILPVLCDFQINQLLFRLRTSSTHDIRFNIRDNSGFPDLMPKNITLVPISHNGEQVDFSNANIEIYQSIGFEGGYHKTFKDVDLLFGSGKVSQDTVFQTKGISIPTKVFYRTHYDEQTDNLGNIIYPENSLVFILLKTSDNQEYYSWLPVTEMIDLYYKGYADSVEVQLPVVKKEDDPTNVKFNLVLHNSLEDLLNKSLDELNPNN
jgi:hypothetical protein